MSKQKHKPVDVLVARIVAWQAIVVALITAAGGVAVGFFARPQSAPQESNNAVQIHSSLLCDRFNVSINEQVTETADFTQPVLLSGTAALKPGYRLWVVAAGPRASEEYWPRDEVVPRNGTWQSPVQPQGNTLAVKPKDEKRFAVMVVGPAGQTLIESYFDILRGSQTVWPALRKKTGDMAVCPGRHRVMLR